MAQDCSERKFLGRLYCNIFLQGDPEARAERRATRQDARQVRRDDRKERRDSGNESGSNERSGSSGSAFWGSLLFGDGGSPLGGDMFATNYQANVSDEPGYDFEQLMNQPQGSNNNGAVTISPTMMIGGLVVILMMMIIVMKR